MTPENVQKAIDNLKNIYTLKEKQLKTFKQLEASLKAQLLGIDVSKGKFTYIPDHDKHFKRMNEDVIVGITNTETQEKFYFDEPVFNFNSICIHNPAPKLNVRYNFLSPQTQTIAEKYLLKKREEEKKNG